MKKIMTPALTLMFALVLGTTALADVAVGPMYAVMFGLPMLVIAIVVIAVALLVRAIKRRKDK